MSVNGTDAATKEEAIDDLLEALQQFKGQPLSQEAYRVYVAGLWLFSPILILFALFSGKSFHIEEYNDYQRQAQSDIDSWEASTRQKLDAADALKDDHELQGELREILLEYKDLICAHFEHHPLRQWMNDEWST